MGKYRKKPVVIEAVRWTGDNWNDCHAFINTGAHHEWHKPNRQLLIRTLEGDHLANDGDWIIRGIKGEFYPCKPDIFEATYEPVDG